MALALCMAMATRHTVSFKRSRGYRHYRGDLGGVGGVGRTARGVIKSSRKMAIPLRGYRRGKGGLRRSRRSVLQVSTCGGKREGNSIESATRLE